MLILFYSRIEGVRKNLYEAASNRRRAGPVRRLVSIKLPLRSRTICIRGNHDNGQLFPNVCTVFGGCAGRMDVVNSAMVF